MIKILLITILVLAIISPLLISMFITHMMKSLNFKIVTSNRFVYWYAKLIKARVNKV